MATNSKPLCNNTLTTFTISTFQISLRPLEHVIHLYLRSTDSNTGHGTWRFAKLYDMDIGNGICLVAGSGGKGEQGT